MFHMALFGGFRRTYANVSCVNVHHCCNFINHADDDKDALSVDALHDFCLED